MTSTPSRGVEISEAALNILFSLHFQECKLFSLFHQSQLIASQPEIAKVKRVRTYLRDLQNLIETFEVWIRNDDKFEKKTDSVCHIFNELVKKCKGSSYMQDVMRDSGAMRAIEQCLQDIVLPEEYPNELELHSVSKSDSVIQCD